MTWQSMTRRIAFTWPWLAAEELKALGEGYEHGLMGMIRNHFYRTSAITALKYKEQRVDDVDFLIVAFRDQLLRHLTDDHSMCFGRCGRTGRMRSVLFSFNLVM